MEKEAALPKNIRQIGEISGREKVCIEDYVMTWIRKRGQEEDRGYLGIFFGERQETEDSAYVFIRGIFEIPAEMQEPQQREALRQEYEKYFGEWTVQGCCVIGVYPTERMKTLGEWLPESGKLIYHLQDQEETLYSTGEEQYQRLRGYFVFYEQNKKMQEYLEELFRDRSVEKESVPDRAIRSFREKIKEKGELKHSNFLRMASSFFVIAILIVGAIVVNRIEDIRIARSLVYTGSVPVSGSQAEGENGQDDSAANDGSPVWKMTGTSEARSNAEESSTTKQSDGAEAKSGANGQSDGTEAKSGANGQPEGTEAKGSADGQPEGTEAKSSANGQPEETEAKSSAVRQTEETQAQDDAAVQNDTQASSSADETAMNIAQYNAIQQAAEEAALTGSDAFWEKADPEEIAEGQEGAGTDAAEGQEESGTDVAQEAAAARRTQAGYVIREGDTLAKICSRYYGSIDRIAEVCEANGIEDANVIMPGQRIVLP